MLFIYRTDTANKTSYARQLIKQLATNNNISPAVLEFSFHKEKFTRPIFRHTPSMPQYSVELPNVIRNTIDRINVTIQCDTTARAHTLLQELITHTNFYRNTDILVKFHTEVESIAYILDWLYFLKSLPEALDLPSQPYKCLINCTTNTLSFHCSCDASCTC